MKGDKFLKKFNNTYYLDDGLDAAPIKIGTRIIKIESEKDDANPVGTKGRVIGSLSKIINMNGKDCIGYAVVWDTMPNIAVGVVNWKIAIDKEIN